MTWAPKPRLKDVQAELDRARLAVKLDPTAKPELSDAAKHLLHANRAERRKLAALDRAYGRELARGRKAFEEREWWRERKIELLSFSQDLEKAS